MKRVLLIFLFAAVAGVPAIADEPSTAATNAPVTDMPPAYNNTASPNTADRERGFEAGGVFGEPTGVSLKYWTDDLIAVQGVLGWSSRQHTDFYVHADVVWHSFNAFPVSRGELPLYFGLGGSWKLRDNGRDDIFGIRFPIGVNYLFENAPVSVFAEFAPVLDVTPSVRGDYTAGVGVRYRF